MLSELNAMTKSVGVGNLVLDKGITILCDGGCHNNQLPTSERQMYGSFAVWNDGKRITSITHNDETSHDVYSWQCDTELWNSSIHGINPSNNIAELEMFISALRYLSDIAERSNPIKVRTTQVRILTDSEFVRGQMNGDKSKSLNTRQHVELARELLASSPWKPTIVHVDNRWVKQVLGH